MEYTVCDLSPSDCHAMAEVDRLLSRTGLRRDDHLEITCGVYDEDDHLCATGSCFGPTLRCMAVDPACQGEGLMNLVVSHLSELQAERGYTHLFLYTKPASARFFRDLGFFEIARVEDKLVFMENRRTGFADWLQAQTVQGLPPKAGAVVMNANPFTLGHRHLLQEALRESDWVHLFVLSENQGPIPASVRKMLVERGTRDLPHVILHDSGPYLISSATFPGYFVKNSREANELHARLDLAIFIRIAEKLGIQTRYVGEEPFSSVTRLYNQVMVRQLPEAGIGCRVVSRLSSDGQAISASAVRQAIHDGRLAACRSMLPESTYAYFASPEGRQTVLALRNASDLIHH